MFNSEERKKIVKIATLLKQAEKIFSEIPNDTQEKILQFHIEGASLNFCLRWGTTAADELIEADKKQKLNVRNKKVYC